MEKFHDFMDDVQSTLNFEGCLNFHFSSRNGMGKIGFTGFAIGILAGFHLCLAVMLLIATSCTTLLQQSLLVWSLYFTSLTFFHFLEFFTTSVCQPNTLSYDSFIVNHSASYTIAAVASWTEYWLSVLIFGKSKFYLVIVVIGLLSVIFGQVLRTAAMWECGENFSHRIVDKKSEKHILVTTGIYQYFRHPSYCGWFYWSIGTQILLCNPLCTIAYAWTAWTFFRHRIEYEELLLYKFFGTEYQQYCRTSMIGIPGITSPIDTIGGSDGDSSSGGDGGGDNSSSTEATSSSSSVKEHSS